MPSKFCRRLFVIYMKMQTNNPENIFVSDVHDLVAPAIKDAKKINEFIDAYIKRRGSLENVNCIFVHLYEETSKDYSLIEKIIHDPLFCKLSELIACIILSIENKNNKEYFDSLLGKIRLVSQNKADDYTWGKAFFGEKFSKCFIRIIPGKDLVLSSDCTDSLVFDKEKLEAFLIAVHKALHDALYYHP